MIPIAAIREAFQYDKTLKTTQQEELQLGKKYLASVNYTKQKLFAAMQQGKTIVFNDYPIASGIPEGANIREHTLDTLRKHLNRKEKIYIRYGSQRTLKKVTVDEVIKRWSRGRSKFGITDLHFRDLPYFTKVDANAVSYFNLLPLFSENVSFLEMLTLVISSKGIFSDSHSDDGDGSNHCILGKKLWFAWDHTEGQKAGLQDCTYDPVYNQAKFDMKKFLSLKSAHWFLVSDGETLFMPGNFTHKVVTLEPYIGFGSFYLSFPNYINSLKRWVLNYSSDVTPEFIEALNKEFLAYLQKKVSKTSKKERENMGFDYFLESLKKWKSGLSKEELILFSDKAKISQILNAAESI